jgi:Mg-chelatase subunit ChlD
MADKVADGSGRQRPKIDIARESVADLVRRFEGYAREHPDRKVAVGIYEFSRREHQPSSRTVVPISAPDLEGAAAALKRVRAKGGTPIGDAMIEAKRALDATGLTRRHILVVTDGENTHGYAPADVTGVLSRQQESRRASVYFVAFDVEAELFKPVRDAGGLVLGAANETDLRQTLDYLLTGKILAEQPSTPAVR